MVCDYQGRRVIIKGWLSPKSLTERVEASISQPFSFRNSLEFREMCTAAEITIRTKQQYNASRLFRIECRTYKKKSSLRFPNLPTLSTVMWFQREARRNPTASLVYDVFFTWMYCTNVAPCYTWCDLRDIAYAA
ncbi:hypothetical protein CLF_109304 [Clonorchis sinensis]|uniref:Uncharacterized protein n=1 Tax=Clonorchis sinensis TaxID=79923 RepID=G7YJ72_CLOSI|nr:hypothetical protein CLF_109304 [Clonorchis sinensis]